ncbi:tripartite tricarboxylate transporter TctB family protein [Paenalcaligenes hominis]|uniref:tripartite tricarboxylate transporter TctB family protein n=1 Tax=Paenalcaligenes hominis TaxID=643674 RepID=UPI003524F606
MMSDRVLGLFCLVIAAVVFWQSYDMVPAFSYEPLGPRAFPMLIGALLALCGLVLVVKNQFIAPRLPQGTHRKILLLFAYILVYALLFQPLGFVVATILMVFLLGKLFGGRTGPLLLSAVLMAGSLYWLFDRVMDVVLPAGLLGV